MQNFAHFFFHLLEDRYNPNCTKLSECKMCRNIFINNENKINQFFKKKTCIVNISNKHLIENLSLCTFPYKKSIKCAKN